MNREVSPLDHHARIVAELERARDNAVQQAQVWAMEAKTQRGIVLELLRELQLPLEDWNAVRLVNEFVDRIHADRVRLADEVRALRPRPGDAIDPETPVLGLPPGWEVQQTPVGGGRHGEQCWSAMRMSDCVEVWMYADGQVEIDNVGAVLLVDELVAVLHHLRSRLGGTT